MLYGTFCYAHHFVDGGDSRLNLTKAVFAKGDHAPFFTQTAQFRYRGILGNNIPIGIIYY